MRKNIILTLIITSLLLTLLLVSGCEDKKSTNIEEILDKDVVEVLLVDNWDLWEMQVNNAPAAKSPVAGKARDFSRDGELYPVLVEELYASIEPHKIMIDGLILDSSTDEIEALHMENNQLWVEDVDANLTYYYDYYYNENSGALWLHEETTSDTVWAVDPLEVDSLGVPLYDVNEFTLLFKYEKGPSLNLIQPANDWIVPDPENSDIDDLTPKFKWSQYMGPGEEYTFQLRTDDLFDETTGFVYNEVLTSVNFTPSVDLDNFENYYWRVKASISDWSEVWNFVTKEIVLLSAPTNNSYLGLKPTFSWDDLNGATSYIIQISQDVNFEGVTGETVTATSYVPTNNLEPEVEYFWRVRGDNSISNGSTFWSDVWSFTTNGRVNMDVAVPSDEATEVVLPATFSWGSIANTSDYHFQVATDSMFVDLVIDDENVTTNSYTETGILEVNNEYFWRVNSDAAFDWGDTLSFKTNTVVLLNSPENEAVDNPVLVEFKWETFNSTSTTYKIQVSDEDTFANPIVDAYIDYDGDEIQCATASKIEENEDDDLIEFIAEMTDDFAASSTFYWRVQRDSLEWSDTWSFTTTALEDPLLMLEPLDTGDDVKLLPKLKWTADSNVDNYRILLSLDPALADTLWMNKVVDGNDYTLDKEENEMLLVGETYYWKVRSDKSEWSEPWSFTVRSGIPYDIEVAGDEEGTNLAATPNKIDLSWECLDGEHDGYLIERSEGAGNTDWTLVDSLAATYYDFVDLGLEQNTVYNYRMRTHYPLGYSDYSPTLTITTATFEFLNNPADNLVTVNSGQFTMGNNSGEADEGPEHSVTLTNSFELGEKEITNVEFCELLNLALGQGFIKALGTVNITYAPGAYDLDEILIEDQCDISFSTTAHIFKVEPERDLYPAAGITYYGAANYCNWLASVEGTTPLYTGTSSLECTVYGTTGFRLPTEAEWEYAATNMGTSSTIYSGSDTIDDVAWYIGNAADDSHPVGEKAANELGIYDMSGNVWEWCNDIYVSYSADPVTDPIGAGGSAGGTTAVVIRGGSWEFDADFLRNTNRSTGMVNLSSKVNTQIGFRIVKIN